MRVLFFNYEYPPLGGGAANATTYILREFAKITDLQIDLVTSSVDAKYHLEKIGDQINIHRLPIGKNEANLHFQSQKDLLVYSWRAYFFSKKLIKRNKYDLTHSFFSVPCGFLSLILKYKFDLPYIVSLRGSDVPGYSDRFGKVYGILTPIIKHIWTKAGAVVSNSNGLRELALRAKPDQKIDIIYNGIDINDFKPNQSLKSQDKFIITLGASRITARKGIKYLIVAISKLVQSHPNILLKIMGEGNDKKNLSVLVSGLKLDQNVQFLGRIPREKTTAYYQEANIFVLPSLNEGMSNAMLEAMACGLPLIATDTGGTKELLTDRQNGLIVKMENSADLAEKIEKLISDESLREKMGQESRQRAEKLNWTNIAEQYYNLYKKINLDR